MTDTATLIALAIEQGKEGNDVEQYTAECAGDIYCEMMRGEREGDAEAFAVAFEYEHGADVRTYWHPASEAPSIHPLPRLRSEFPDYPVADLPAIPAHWEDASWHNDACPFFTIAPMVGMFVDYPDQAQRETGGERFTVVPLEDGQHVAEARTLYHGDDWSEALATAIAAAFVANLRSSLGDATFDDLRYANRHAPAGTCASHNYCDANMPMAKAFETVTGRDISARDAIADADAALWNRAWALAMPDLTDDDDDPADGCRTCRESIETRASSCDECGAVDDVPPDDDE